MGHNGVVSRSTRALIDLSNVPMFQCTNVPMYQCFNVLLYQCTNVSMFYCTNVPMYQWLTERGLGSPRKRELSIRYSYSYSLFVFVFEYSYSSSSFLNERFYDVARLRVWVDDLESWMSGQSFKLCLFCWSYVAIVWRVFNLVVSFSSQIRTHSVLVQ